MRTNDSSAQSQRQQCKLPGTTNWRWLQRRAQIVTNGARSSSVRCMDTTTTCPSETGGDLSYVRNSCDRAGGLSVAAINLHIEHSSTYAFDNLSQGLPALSILRAVDEPRTPGAHSQGNGTKELLVSLHGGWWQVALLQRRRTGRSNAGQNTIRTPPNNVELPPRRLRFLACLLRQSHQKLRSSHARLPTDIYARCEGLGEELPGWGYRWFEAGRSSTR